MVQSDGPEYSPSIYWTLIASVVHGWTTEAISVQIDELYSGPSVQTLSIGLDHKSLAGLYLRTTLMSVSLITLVMFIGPRRLVLKAFCMSSTLHSRVPSLNITPALLTSRLRPSAPKWESTFRAHSLMLPRSVASGRGGSEKYHRTVGESI